MLALSGLSIAIILTLQFYLVAESLNTIYHSCDAIYLSSRRVQDPKNLLNTLFKLTEISTSLYPSI